MFTCSKVIDAFKRQNSWTDTFRNAVSFIFPTLSSQNMRGFDHATILSSSFQGVRKERLAQWPAFCVPNTTKKPGGGGGLLPEKLGGGVQHPWNPYPIYLIKNLIPYFRPGARRMTGARDKLLRHVHGSRRKHYKGNLLIAKWWRSS